MKNTMTVRELINILAQYNLDTEIRFRDTYWENEGYGERADDPNYLTRRVVAVHMKQMNGETVAVLQ